MKTKFKQALICAGIAGVFLLTSVAQAGVCGKGSGKDWKHKEKRCENLTKELNLTAEQEAQMKKQRQEQMEKHKELREQLRTKMKELKEALEAKEIDKGKIYGFISEITALKKKQLEYKAEKVLSMREILTPEQFEKFKQKTERYKEKAEYRRKQRKKKFKKHFRE